ncbi:MAG: hypothetical protein J0L92_38485 [Deltaproteobacteria bacterium]|nr:hypothetical protein [Deltaproteobacteria bacterium]
MHRASRLILIALGVIALGGCPRELEPPPAAGDPCATETDCNPSGVTCGALRLCVGGHCEAGQSLHVPCR